MHHVAMAFITLEAWVYRAVIFDESHSHRYTRYDDDSRLWPQSCTVCIPATAGSRGADDSISSLCRKTEPNTLKDGTEHWKK